MRLAYLPMLKVKARVHSFIHILTITGKARKPKSDLFTGYPDRGDWRECDFVPARAHAVFYATEKFFDSS